MWGNRFNRGRRGGNPRLVPRKGTVGEVWVTLISPFEEAGGTSAKPREVWIEADQKDSAGD